nr:MAG: structural protein VP337 [White spot syndrome virus]BDX26498.1 MAG: structural protein VP337 [White spot syndrome virus]
MSSSQGLDNNMCTTEILLPKCTSSSLSLEESVDYLEKDFEELGIPLVEGKEVLLEFAYKILNKRDTIRVIGDEQGDVCSVFFLRFGKKKTFNPQTKMWLVKLANAIALSMGVVPEPACTCSRMMTTAKKIPVPESYKNVNRNIQKFEDVHYIDINFQSFVREQIGLSVLGKNDVQKKKKEETPFFAPFNKSKIGGECIEDLKYDSESVSIIRDVFNLLGEMPTEDVKTSRSCINPSHNDTNPSMRLVFRPMYWRNSKLVMDKLSKEQDSALIEKYMGGEHQHCIIGGRNVLLYCITALCFSSDCGFKKMLTNDEIKQLIWYLVLLFFHIICPIIQSK